MALLYIAFVLEGTSISYLLLAATFFLGVSVYSLNKVTDLNEDSINSPDRFRFAKKYRNYLLLASIESMNIAVVFAFFSDPYAILLILGIFYAGALYSLRVSRLRVKKTLVGKNFIGRRRDYDRGGSFASRRPFQQLTHRGARRLFRFSESFY